jgi:hypothetical protein
MSLVCVSEASVIKWYQHLNGRVYNIDGVITCNKWEYSVAEDLFQPMLLKLSVSRALDSCGRCFVRLFWSVCIFKFQ